MKEFQVLFSDTPKLQATLSSTPKLQATLARVEAPRGKLTSSTVSERMLIDRINRKLGVENPRQRVVLTDSGGCILIDHLRRAKLRDIELVRFARARGCMSPWEILLGPTA